MNNEWLFYMSFENDVFSAAFDYCFNYINKLSFALICQVQLLYSVIPLGMET